MTSKFGLILNINCSTETITHKYVCDTLDNCYIEIIECLTNEINKLTIDFPLELDKFEYIWFNQTYTTNNFFSYSIFYNDVWLEEKWSAEEVYDEIITKIFEIENNNPAINDENIDSDNEEQLP
jgi:hypothetical protein